MQDQIKLESLDQLRVCQHQSCNLPINIYHERFFKSQHYDVSKKVAHQSISFKQSPQYLNYLKIVKIQKIIRKKLTQAFNGFNTPLETITQTALFNSELFSEIFNSSNEAKNEYFLLRSVENGYKELAIVSLSEQFCMAVSFLPDFKILKIYKTLYTPSVEWQHLNSLFSNTLGVNSSHFEYFIEQERVHFVQFCHKLINEGKSFNINEFIKMKNVGEYPIDQTYFSKEFTTFLIDKYEKNPQKQEIFTAIEYYLNFWQYFYLLVDSSTLISQYIDQEIQFYQLYEKYMQQINIPESLLSYQVWRFNSKGEKEIKITKNTYFIQTFIYEFLQDLIDKKNYFPEEEKSYEWRKFIIYLKDYVKFTKDFKQAFNFPRYRQYLQFRKKHIQFQAILESNKEIIYNKSYFLEYLHHELVENNKLSIKKYKKFVDKKDQQELERINQEKIEAQKLKIQLEQEQKQNFYEYLYLNYLSYLLERNQKISKQSYYLFKAAILNTVDIDYIKEEQQRYKMTREEYKTEQKGSKFEKNQEIQDIGDIYNESLSSGEEQDEDNDEPQELCLCCSGKPYDCKEAECVVMGCCTACMLD